MSSYFARVRMDMCIEIGWMIFYFILFQVSCLPTGCFVGVYMDGWICSDVDEDEDGG